MGINNSPCCGFMDLSKNKRYIESLAKPFILSFGILILCTSLFIGCGKKAPPVAPHQVQPQAVKDLSYRLDGDTLKLTWTIPKGDEKNQSSLTAFILYQSKRPIAEKECKSCPVRFKRVADIPVDKKSPLKIGKDKAKPLSYSETLEKGFRYVYKVIGLAQNDRTSDDSNYISFSY